MTLFSISFADPGKKKKSDRTKLKKNPHQKPQKRITLGIILVLLMYCDARIVQLTAQLYLLVMGLAYAFIKFLAGVVSHRYYLQNFYDLAI